MTPVEEIDDPDSWLKYGNPLEKALPQYANNVDFYGRTQHTDLHDYEDVNCNNNNFSDDEPMDFFDDTVGPLFQDKDLRSRFMEPSSRTQPHINGLLSATRGPTGNTPASFRRTPSRSARATATRRHTSTPRSTTAARRLIITPPGWTCKDCCTVNPLTRSTCTHCHKKRYRNNIKPPDYWNDDGSDDTRQVLISEDAVEYKTMFNVLNRNTTTTLNGITVPVVVEDSPNVDILWMKRNENFELYLQYKIRSDLIQSMMPPNMSSELVLYHGCSAAAAKNILQDGFSKSYLGTNVGTVLGKGLYFSSDPFYCLKDKFSPIDRFDNQILLVCRVAVGNFTTGNPELMEPPYINGNYGQRYDAVVDDIEKPVVYCVFSEVQAYPDDVLKVKVLY